MNRKSNWNPISTMSAFLVGVILFWSIGNDWLDLKSGSVFLAGLVGAAVAVLFFSAWNLRHRSHHEKK